MEFNRLADVDVVETANDTDKVLIEQNGEIKRIPKTEVGGGKMLIVNITKNPDTGEFTDIVTSMTLDETIKAIDKRELTGAISYVTIQGMVALDMLAITNATLEFGKPCLVLGAIYYGVDVFWTADGISMEPPTLAEAQ